MLRLFEAAALSLLDAGAGAVAVSLASEPLAGGLGAAGGARGGAAPGAGGELGAAVGFLVATLAGADVVVAAAAALRLPDFTRIESIMPRSSWRRK
jgi:hypothetical protein